LIRILLLFCVLLLKLLIRVLAFDLEISKRQGNQARQQQQCECLEMNGLILFVKNVRLENHTIPV
jgi:hypothetical protein